MRARRAAGRFGLPPWAREALLALGCLLLLGVALFPDVIFLERTTATSATSPGVLGAPPHAGYPKGAVLERNPYLRDPLASAVASEPAARYASRIVGDPGLALWDPYRSLGQPVLATANPQVVSPIRWPLAAVPTPLGWDAFILLRLVATGVLAHLLAWRLGLSRWSCITASVIAAAGGFTALHVNSVHVDQLVAMAIGMHAVLTFARSRGPGSLLGVGAAGYLVLVADNLQAGVLGLLYLTAFSVHLLRRERIGLPRSLGLASLVAATPVLLASFVLIPLVELAGSPLTAGLSVHRHTADRLVGLVHHSPQALADLLVPYIGHDVTPWFDINLGVGLVVTLLALLGAGHRGPHRRFLVGAAVVLLLKTFGAPVVNSLGELPVINGINFLLYGAAPLQLTLALLAGAGVERLRDRSLSATGVLATAAAAAVGAAGLVVWRLPDDVDRAGLLTAHLVLLLAVAGIIAWGTTRTRSEWHRVAVAALVCLQIVLLWVPRLGAVVDDARVEQALAIPVVDRPLRADPYTAPRFVGEIQRRADPDDRLIARGGLLFPNSAGVFGLDDLRGTSGFTVARFHGLVVNFIDPREPWRFDGRGWDGLLDPRAHPRLPEVIDLLGVEWVISHGLLPDVPEADRYPELRRVFTGSDAVVYRNPDAFPGAFLVHDAVAVASPDAAFEQIADPALDLRRTAVLETQRLPVMASPGDHTTTVEPLVLTAARSRYVVDTPTPGVLVVSDTFYPGWEARVNGTDTEVMPAYGALRAVAVPAGRSSVEFAFRPTSLLLGSAVSITTLIGLLGAATAARFRRRRSDDRLPAEQTGSTSTFRPGKP